MKKLDAEEIFRPNEQNILIGCDGEVHQKVPTTMDVAKERARQGVPDGYVILAERQTNGRGREGAWECSSRSGLLLTIILHANLPPEERHIMGILGPLSATEVFREMGVDAWIKWPNDIVTIESTSPLLLCKMGGTLVEQADRGDGPPDHLLG
ncbi:MAG: biotin--[acetyl-CoA-carboxylase] ligase, partial [Planctomycetota bacterium]